jgi:hypothetical protein
MTRIPDPVELSESRIERMIDLFVDEYTCMNCGVRQDYECVCMSPIGDGPLYCMKCAGLE